MIDARIWDEQYVLGLPPGEHNWVEFKGARLLDFSLSGVKVGDVLNELSRQLSAFANSGGGHIVYGIKNTPLNQPRVVDEGGVSNQLKNGTKEWLEDVIPNLVEYPLTDFNVYAIVRNEPDSLIEEDKAIYVVSIQDSLQAPHQANDGRYYARVAGKTKPISHRLVSDIANRPRHPKMAIELEIVEDNDKLFLDGRCRNVGKIYANYVVIFLYVPTDIVNAPFLDVLEKNGSEYYEEVYRNLHRDVVNSQYSPGVMGDPGVSLQRFITRYEPVLPRLAFDLRRFEIPLTKYRLRQYANVNVYWELFADNAPPDEGAIAIKKIPRR